MGADASALAQSYADWKNRVGACVPSKWRAQAETNDAKGTGIRWLGPTDDATHPALEVHMYKKDGSVRFFLETAVEE